MQFLTFSIGKDRYGLATSRVASVLPLMALKAIPQTPDYVTGLMNFHGAPVPVLDLAMLANGSASAQNFDTRIVLLDYPLGDGSSRRLGLIAERVAAVVDHDPASFDASGVDNSAALWLGRVTSADGSLLQLVEVAHLLTPAVRAILFDAAPSPEPAC